MSAGGVPTKNGARKVTIRPDQPGDLHPEGLAADADARVVLDRAVDRRTCSTSTCPMAASARARVGTAVLKLPGLRTPVTK